MTAPKDVALTGKWDLNWKTVLPGCTAIIVFCFAIFAVNRLLNEIQLSEVYAEFQHFDLGTLIVAAFFLVLCNAAYMGYDALALRHCQAKIPLRRSAPVAFSAFAIGHNVGLATISSAAVRYRVYTSYGLPMRTIATVIAFVPLTYFIGASTVLGALFLIEPNKAFVALEIKPALAQWIGLMLMLVVVAYLAIAAFWGGEKKVFAFRFAWPSIQIGTGQVLIGISDFIFAGSVLYCLLTQTAEVQITSFFVAYVFAMVATSLSNVPGGIGVFESVLLILLPHVEKEGLIAAILLFRVYYFLVPLSLAIVTLLCHETLWLKKRRGSARHPS